MGQAGSRRSDSGDERGSEEQDGCVEEGLSFASESNSSSREGGSMTEDAYGTYVSLHIHSPSYGPPVVYSNVVSALSTVSLEEDSPVELSPSDNDTPTLQLNSDSSSDSY